MECCATIFNDIVGVDNRDRVNDKAKACGVGVNNRERVNGNNRGRVDGDDKGRDYSPQIGSKFWVNLKFFNV